MVKKVLFLQLYLGVLVLPGISMAQNDCAKHYVNAENNVLFPEVETKIKYLESIEVECKKTAEFVIRISELYISELRYKEAEVLLNKALRASSGTDHGRLKFSLADMYFVSGQLKKSETEATQIIAAYPKWFAGYFVRGSVYLNSDRTTEAISDLEKSALLSNESEAYASLAIAYHKGGRNVETLQAMDKAISLDKKSYANRLAVPAAVYAYANLNRLEDAKKLLIIHQHYRPESQNDPEFSRAVRYVEDKLKNHAGAKPK